MKTSKIALFMVLVGVGLGLILVGAGGWIFERRRAEVET